MLRLAKKQSKGTPLIIHTHSSKAGILGRIAGFLAGVPIIIHSFHGFGFNDFQPWLVRKAYILAEKIAGLITDSFIFVSRANLQKASQLGIGKPSKYNLIRSGISIDEFKPRQIDILAKRKELGVGSGKLVVMVSNLKPQKNPLDFARVANLVLKKTPDAWFILCGDGELRPELERMIEDFGIKDRVKLLGWRRDIPEILWASDLLILTSLWEGLPRVYPQAMASGLAIVGTRVDGGPEAVIDGENGYLLEPGDYQGISQRVIELLEDDEKRKKMGQRGMEMVAEFDIHKMVKDQEQLYQRLLKEKNLWN
jgi:glycosyltransferase involved in cell wall biosynthesis